MEKIDHIGQNEEREKVEIVGKVEEAKKTEGREQTEHNRDILSREYLKENPYTLPKNYFSKVEDEVQKKITAEEGREGSFASVLKTTIALACTFGLILGMGKGAMLLTKRMTGTEIGDKSSLSADLPENENIEESEIILSLSSNYQLIDLLSQDEVEEMAAGKERAAEYNRDGTSFNKTNGTDSDKIEDYLIDSNISLITLASIE